MCMWRWRGRMWKYIWERDCLLKALSVITAVAETGNVTCPAIYVYLEPTSERQKSSMNNDSKAFLKDIYNLLLLYLSLPLLENLFTPHPLFQSSFLQKPPSICLMVTGSQFCWPEVLLAVWHTLPFFTPCIFICVSYFSLLNNYCKLWSCLKYASTDNYMAI